MNFFRKLRSWVKRIIYKTIGPKIFYRTTVFPDGMRMKVDITDALGRKIYFHKELPDSFELGIVRRLVQKGDICIDVGANIGLYTSIMALSVAENGKVYAFEPSCKTFKILAENVRLNSFKNVFLFNEAVSDRSGKTVFFEALQSGLSGLGDTGRGTVVEKHSVLTTTLDEFVKERSTPRIDFLKVDVEGFEGHVLRGARNVLASQENLVLMIELDKKNFEHLGFSVSEAFSFLKNSGYRGYYIDRESKTLKSINNQNPPAVNFLFSKKDILIKL